jgi:hypothetical protein
VTCGGVCKVPMHRPLGTRICCCLFSLLSIEHQYTYYSVYRCLTRLKTLIICLHFTLGYHPQADRQTKRINQILEQYLWIHCNYQQDNWAEWLPIAEFAYNNAKSSTTGTTPFFANKGYYPELPTYPDCLSTS